MGGNQSRVETSDVETELKNHGERQGESTASINLTPALVAQLNDKSPAEPAAAQRHAVTLTPEYVSCGASDFRKDFEAKQKKQAESASAAVDPAKQAQHAKELEAKENARVQRLVDEISRKKYRAPLNDVQCSPERDACLQCYRDKQSDILQCKEVADAFIRCSQQTTEVRIVQ
ncbi:hypothetical protein FI667_g4782, partial [Globisporangium splendens]